MASERKELTDTELSTLVFMRDFFRENDQLPTQEVLRVFIGTKSKRTPIAHLDRLEAKGYIERNAVNKWRFTRQSEAA